MYTYIRIAKGQNKATNNTVFKYMAGIAPQIMEVKKSCSINIGYHG